MVRWFLVRELHFANVTNLLAMLHYMTLRASDEGKKRLMQHVVGHGELDF